VNLLVGGILRIRKGRATAGVLVAHLGIGVLLVASFVSTYFSDSGHVTFFEGESAAHFESYHRWELVLARDLGDGRVEEHLVPEEAFVHATGPAPARVTAPELPFAVEVRHFMPNARPLPKGPMFDVPVPVVDGVFLKSEPRRKENEANLAGAYVSVVTPAGERTDGVLWGVAAQPLTVSVGGERWAVDLRRERYAMPFTVQLDDFTKEDHPGTAMPKWFSSDVTVTEDSTSRPVLISMNEPLRAGGLVLYQASWGPSNARPGEPLFSTLAVVRNPADRVPAYACGIIVAGLLAHFWRKLARHVRVEAKRA
jgi:cytochrome c biogenesis protein ResB